ncbi:MAG TPA: carbon monoxide dehydrogenase subunit G [Bacillales bacterium]|nr:carbon monoxide dehydrogenase subunit G [Bacillales bacterium]
MQIQYRHFFQVPRQVLWDHLQDEEVLGKTLPGCKKFEKVEEGLYHSELGLNIGPVKGTFTGKVRLSDQQEPEFYRLSLNGKGKPGELSADAEVHLKETQDGTELTCEADAHSTGILASVGQRVMNGVAKMLLKQFFKAVEKETSR